MPLDQETVQPLQTFAAVRVTLFPGQIVVAPEAEIEGAAGSVQPFWNATTWRVIEPQPVKTSVWLLDWVLLFGVQVAVRMALPDPEAGLSVSQDGGALEDQLHVELMPNVLLGVPFASKKILSVLMLNWLLAQV